MDGFEFSRLPGLLDDPLIISDDLLPFPSNVHIAPLRNPAPARYGNVSAPLPLEPLADNATHTAKEKRQSNGTTVPAASKSKSSPYLKQRDALVKKNTKKPNLAISELVEAHHADEPLNGFIQLPSFVSLAVVEKSPAISARSLNIDRRFRSDIELLAESSRDDYRHLPFPAQTGKTAIVPPLPLLPAMVAGLNEPPLSAGLLPSMELETTTSSGMLRDTGGEARGSKRKRDGRSHGLPPEMMINSPELGFVTLPDTTLDYPEIGMSAVGEGLDDHVSPETEAKTKSTKSHKKKIEVVERRAPRKWSTAESTYLMTGVTRYGVGKWKQILRDKSFTFQDRKPGDLKDRYRVCTATPEAKTRPTKPRDRSKIPADPPDDGDAKTRRRKWTQEEDDALLQGLAKHGFGWTAMQSDLDIGLSHRRATDLRDRVRTKFPDSYRHAGATSLQDHGDEAAQPHKPELGVAGDKGISKIESAKQRSISGIKQATAATVSSSSSWPAASTSSATMIPHINPTYDPVAPPLPTPTATGGHSSFNWNDTVLQHLPSLMDWDV